MAAKPRVGSAAVAAVLLLALNGVARGAEGPERETEEEPRVYTNADLEKYAEPGNATDDEAVETSTSPESAAPTIERPDPLQAIEDEQAVEESRRAQLARAEGEVARLRARVDELEARRLAVRNPYLPRPKLTPEEEAAWKGLSGPERLRLVETQLEEARKALAVAEGEVERLRSRP